MYQKNFVCDVSGSIYILLQVEIKHRVSSSIEGHSKNDKTLIGIDTSPEDFSGFIMYCH